MWLCATHPVRQRDTGRAVSTSSVGFPFRVAAVDATLFALSEGKERHCSST
jgi:hypothetical protein